MKKPLTKRSEAFQFEINVGQLKDLTDDVATLIVKQICDHEPATAFFKDRVPKGKTREVVAYSDELAAEYLKLQRASLEKVFTDVSISVSKREKGATETKFVEEIAIASRHESAGDLESWLADKCAFTGETHDTDGEFATPMLLAIKEYKKAALKGL